MVKMVAPAHLVVRGSDWYEVWLEAAVGMEAQGGFLFGLWLAA